MRHIIQYPSFAGLMSVMSDRTEVVCTHTAVARAAPDMQRAAPGLPYELVPRERRVLVPIGRPCPFGCRYCYADDPTMTSAQPLSVPAITAALENLNPDSFDIIQLGYDGDPLTSTRRLREMLPVLADTGKHINISTKGRASAGLRAFLGEMHQRTPQGLSLNVSATCWDSAGHIEPRTPAPARRLSSAAALRSETSIPFVLSLRPLLPSVLDRELHKLLDHALASGATAAVTGPLYVQPDGSNMAWSGQSYEHVPEARVTWSPIPVRYRRIDDSLRVDGLRSYAEQIGLPLHSKNAPALRQLVETACQIQHQDHCRQV